MLSVYTNQQELLNATSTTQVSRIDAVDQELLNVSKFSVTLKDSTTPLNLELHVYTPDGVYLTGNHNSLYSIEYNDTSNQDVAYRHLAIDTSAELENLGISRGQYRLIYNYFDNVLGSFDTQQIWIKDISPSRRELKLLLSDNANTTLRAKLSELRDRWEAGTADGLFDSFILNFGFNNTYKIVNFWFDIDKSNPEFYVRLYNPLPSQFVEKTQAWISEEVIDSILNVVTVVPAHIANPVTNLAPPNFELEIEDGGSVATNFKSWNDLLSSNIQTSQQIIDAQFSGSLSGIKLNISYRQFDNFIHFGSATEQVKNFKYKLQLIEYYSDKIELISKVPGGTATQTNLTDLYTKRNKVVSGFNDFEKYLFFESTGSILYTHLDSATGSIDPWPKVSSDASQLTWAEAYMLWSNALTSWASVDSADPYSYFATQERTDSTVGESYYNNLTEIAEIYDRNNIHKLQNSVPLYIQDSEGGEELLLFVHMLGQHFDILWTYINALTSIHTREEHPKDGMPGDLLYQVASTMGFDLLNGKSTSELWKYSLGTDVNGNTLQTNANGITSISDSDNTKEIWRRIVNNLPYILKSKGTSRSIKALLTCFGIPTSFLTIKEYGGPSTFTDNDHFPEYVHDVYHYAWLSDPGNLQIPVSQYTNGQKQQVSPNTIEFRFKTDNNYTYGLGNYYNILSISSGSLNDVYNLVLTKESGDDKEGTLTLFSKVTGNAISASNLQIFDNSWHSVIIESTNSTSSLKVGKSLYGKTIYIKSSSYNGDLNAFPLSGTQYVNFSSGSRSVTPTLLPNGSTVTTLNKFYGHYHEIRLWSGSLNTDTIGEHAASANTYTYNVNRNAPVTGQEGNDAYDHLLQRFTLANKIILSGSFYQNSIHPNQSLNTGAIYFINYTDSGSIKFEGFEETYYTPSPSLGGASLYTNKVRIESSSIIPGARLNTKTRVEKSSFDRYSLDSNKLGVYFSPQTAINEDIFNQLGYFEIDDYIGDPSDVYKTQYTALKNFGIQYWKKHIDRSNFEDYFRVLQIYDFTIFKYIKRLLPQRASVITGLVVEPNVLERSKVISFNKPTIENLVHNASISGSNPTLSGVYQDVNAEINFLEYTNIAVDYYNQLTSTINIIPTLTSNVVQFSSTIEGSINTDRLGTKWIQNRTIGKYKITYTGSFNPLQQSILNSRNSSYLLKKIDFYDTPANAALQIPFSSSYIAADINIKHGLSYDNLRWNGCKLTGAGINIDSPNTVDGGPVVKVTKVNPNQIVFANNQVTTLKKSVSGDKKKSI